MDVQAGIEALEEVLKSSLLHAEKAKTGDLSTYRFVHDLIRDVVYTEIGEARRQVLHQRAFAVLQREEARASDCWAQLAFAQVQVGQLSSSIQNGYRSLTLARKIKNTWVQIANTVPLTSGLLDAGRYEEALVIMQQAVELTKTLPPTFNFYRLLTVLGSTYQALQVWEEAHQTLAEADTMAEKLSLKLYLVPMVVRLC